PGWSLHFGRVIGRGGCPDANQNALLDLPDGRLLVLQATGLSSPRQLSRDRFRGDCAFGATSSVFVVHSPEGLGYEFGFAHDGVLYATRISDANGNHVDVHYAIRQPHVGATLVAVNSVTASDGRSITFDWLPGDILGGFHYEDPVTLSTHTWTYTTEN